MRELVEILKEKTKDIAEIDLQPLRQRLVAKQQLPALVQSHLSKPDVSQISINNAEALARFIETLILKAFLNPL